MKRILFIILVLMGLSTAAWSEAQMLDRVVAVVNDDAITQSELDAFMRPLYLEYKDTFKGQTLFQKLSEARVKLLNQLIEDRLVFQEAKDQGIQVNDLDIEKQMQDFKSQFPSEEALENALTEQAVSLATLRERLQRQAMVRQLHSMEIRSKIVVSPVEIQKYYEEHPEEFTQRDQLKVRSLTIKKSNEAKRKGLKDEEGWDLVHEILKKIKSGEDFGELALKNSQDMHRDTGGLADNWVQRGEMIDVIDKAIFKIKKGDTTDVIETSIGYHLFLIEDKKAGKKVTFEDARDQIYSILFQQKNDELFEGWMSKLKNQSYISIR